MKILEYFTYFSVFVWFSSYVVLFIRNLSKTLYNSIFLNIHWGCYTFNEFLFAFAITSFLVLFNIPLIYHNDSSYFDNSFIVELLKYLGINLIIIVMIFVFTTHEGLWVFLGHTPRY